MIRHLRPGGLGLVLVLLLVGPASALQAQHPFSDCAARTGPTATVFLPDTVDIRIHNTPPAGTVDVALYTENGRCAGVVAWGGDAAALTAWGTAPPAEADAAFTPDAPMHVRLYDRTTGALYHRGNSRISVSLATNRPFLHPALQFVANGMYVVERINVEAP